MSVTIFQTADAHRYRRMLEATSRTVIEFCRRHGHNYESYIGIKRGYHPWQATYNRIIQYRELADRDFTGWAMYLDADAYIWDLDFDFSGYLADKQDRAGVLVPSGASPDLWNVNAGVTLVNLGHPRGRELLDAWYQRFAALSDDFLRDADSWPDVDNDQHMLACILQESPELCAAFHFESPDLINSMHARFVRQQLRAYMPSLEERTSSIELLVDRIMGPREGERAEEKVAPAIVAALYRSLFHRDPDPEGLRSYSDHICVLGIEWGTASLLGILLGSSEFIHRPR